MAPDPSNMENGLPTFSQSANVPYPVGLFANKFQGDKDASAELYISPTSPTDDFSDTSFKKSHHHVINSDEPCTFTPVQLKQEHQGTDVNYEVIKEENVKDEEHDISAFMSIRSTSFTDPKAGSFLDQANAMSPVTSERQATNTFIDLDLTDATTARAECTTAQNTTREIGLGSCTNSLNPSGLVSEIVNTNKKAFKCNKCEKTFTFRCYLERHSRSCIGFTPFQCEICKKFFTEADKLANHTCRHEKPQSKSKTKEAWKCNNCEKLFTCKSHLKSHSKSCTPTPYQCELCKKFFKDADKLAIHIRRHAGESPYKCDICGKVFNQSHNLTIHRRYHTGEKPYQCDVCGQSFVSQTHLITHKRKHTGEKPYECKVCGKSFARSSQLKAHSAIHSDDKPYKCETCGKSFILRERLTTHRKTHSEERPYECKVCGKTFKSNSVLKTHNFTHTGEKRYKCTLCDKGYTSSLNLKLHLRSVHS